jgi:hypothetical protein
MEHRRLFDDAWSYNPNLRAEDGLRIPDRTSTFREFVLIPIGFLFATLLLILLITCSALGQAGNGRIAGSVKDPTGAVILGSSVTLRNTATGVTQATTAMRRGCIIPNLDSIAEFRILSSNVDAEYGSFAISLRLAQQMLLFIYPPRTSVSGALSSDRV